MKTGKIRSLFYNSICLGLFFVGLYYFLWRFSGVIILILTRNDPKLGSDYWLDQPLVVYSGFIGTYVVHWLLLIAGRKHSLVSNRMLRIYLVLDILIYICGTILGYLLLFSLITGFPAEKYGFTDFITGLFSFFLLFLPQFIICNVLLFCRFYFIAKEKKTKTD